MNYTRAFHVGALLATASAPMILQPWAFYIVVLIGTLFSNPEGMDESVRNWRTTANDGETFELQDLREELNKVKEELKAGKWEGGAYEQFEEVHDSFVDSVEQLERIRNDTGDAVASHATLLKIAGAASAATGFLMFVLGLCLMTSRLTPGTAVVAQFASAMFGKTALATMRKILANNVKAAAVLAAIMVMVVQYTETTGQGFPTAKPIPTEMSMMGDDPMNMRQPFTNDGLQYDEQTGQLLPDTTMEV